MDGLIAHVSSGVGQKRERKSQYNKSVLIRLGSSRSSDDLLPDDDSSDDEEYQPPTNM